MGVGAIRAYPHFDVYISKSLQDFIFIEIIRLKHRAVLHKERRTVAFLTALACRRPVRVSPTVHQIVPS